MLHPIFNLCCRFGPYFVEPVVAGIDKKGKPFICAMDLIGAPVFAEDFVVSGTASEELYGTCESLYTPNLGPEELFETVSQALLAAVDRDCLSGWGATVHIMYVYRAQGWQSDLNGVRMRV